MTCQYAHSLLDGWLDSELSPEDNNQLDEHLDNCAQCRIEFESSAQVLDILNRRPIFQPPTSYWEEVTSLILARTVDNEPEASGKPSQESLNKSGTLGSDYSDRSILMRPLISVVASLGLLFAALFVGANKNLFTPRADSPVVQEQSLTAGKWLVNADDRYYISPEDEAMLTRGMLLLAPPGPLSRFEAANILLR